MRPSEVREQELPKRHRSPIWTTPLYLTVLFLLVHVAPPWGLSLLSTRIGWQYGRPGLWNLLALILVAAGIGCTLWTIVLHYLASPRAFLELERTQRLLTPGPYAFSRNPMYLSELVLWLGWALFYGSVPVLIGFFFWFGLFHFLVVPREERELEARFGEPYRQYQKTVPRWLRKPRS